MHLYIGDAANDNETSQACTATHSKSDIDKQHTAHQTHADNETAQACKQTTTRMQGPEQSEALHKFSKHANSTNNTFPNKQLMANNILPIKQT